MKKKAKKIIYWLLAATLFMAIPAHTWADPTCEVKVKDPGPPKIINFIFQESQVGLKTITVKEYMNANVTMPGFFPGFTAPVTVTVTQINANIEFYAVIEATDMNNRKTICRYPGSDPPQCSVIDEDPGPPFTVSFSIVDQTEGLNSILVEEAVNAGVDIPTFTVGTTEPVIVRAQKIDEFADFRVTLAVSDVDGNQNSCGYDQQAPQDTHDPQVFLSAIEPGPPTQLEITAQDSESGIRTITTVEATNAEVQIPGFAVGTTEPVVITASQTVENLEFRVVIEVVDRSDNKTVYRYETANMKFRPEIDLVGEDTQYFFRDDWISQIFINGKDVWGSRINNFSAFQPEFFSTNAGQATIDTCYSTPTRTYLSVLTPTWTEAEYEWEIVLQMKPATDPVLKLHGCVFRTGENDVWTAGYQTGFYTVPWAPNQPVFVSAVNPRLTVRALPGPMAKKGFPSQGFFLDTRRHSGLQVAPLADSLITVQTLASESIVIALPSQGGINASGQTMYSLSQGDRIKVVVSIPGNTTADVRFGESGAVLQYIGMKGTEYTTNP
jgi:hypothetical protein